MSLFQKLTDLNKSDIYPFHMPGHKRNMSRYEIENLYDIDITEINGFDNLHHAEGILKELQDRINDLYRANRTWISINGSTAGILSAISAVCNDGDAIILDRRSHKAAFNACALKNLRMKFIYPDLDQYDEVFPGKILVEEVQRAIMECPEAKAVFITSPSYDGIISDIESIADFCHEKEIPIIVDAAHGAHFILDKRFGTSALIQGADIVIHSIHKTLPAPTQTALLSLKSDLVNEKKLETYMSIYQTSSPSYVLMAGIERCIDIVCTQGEELTKHYFENYDSFAKRIEDLKNIRVLGYGEDKDPSKLIIYPIKDSKKINGVWIGTILRHQFRLEPEMVTPGYVCCLTSIMDTQEGFERLAEALIQMDEIIDLMPEMPEEKSEQLEMTIKAATQMMMYEKNGDVKLQGDYRLRDSLEGEKELINLEKSEGHYSADFVQVYPPGIPILIPGMQIKDKHIEMLCRYIRCNLMVEGIHDNDLWILK